jgi:hypothetical protein
MSPADPSELPQELLMLVELELFPASVLSKLIVIANLKTQHTLKYVSN